MQSEHVPNLRYNFRDPFQPYQLTLRDFSSYLVLIFIAIINIFFLIVCDIIVFIIIVPNIVIITVYYTPVINLLTICLENLKQCTRSE